MYRMMVQKNFEVFTKVEIDKIYFKSNMFVNFKWYRLHIKPEGSGWGGGGGGGGCVSREWGVFATQ